jgi:UDP-galactopyranose mutase
LNTQWVPRAEGLPPTPTHFGPRGRDRQTLICFSHLRWDFVFQRPQHLMTRFAQGRRVIFWEEPVAGPLETSPRLDCRTDPQSGVLVVTPVLPDGGTGAERDAMLGLLLDGLLAGYGEDLIRWYYTPMMLSFSRHLDAICTVYDCMDELANFKFAPPELTILERELMGLADVVFTGGYSLWEAKRDRHPNIHPFPPASTALTSPRPGWAGGSRTTWLEFPGRGWASMGWSTSVWTSTCWPISPTRARPGAWSSSGRW